MQVSTLKFLQKFTINLEWNFDLSIKAYNALTTCLLDLDQLQHLVVRITKHTFIPQDIISDFRQFLRQNKPIRNVIFDNEKIA